jgi:RHS repeat-associated protein
VGDRVTLRGTGFAAVAADNVVRFNGTLAAVREASATQLTVTVPAGATSGPISVTTPAGSTTSSDPFDVGGKGPQITGLSARVAEVGDVVTLSGRRFDTTALVDVNGTAARVMSATSTELRFEVPNALSGRVEVSTADGRAVGPDLFVAPSASVAPPGYAAADVGTTVRLAPGEATRVTLGGDKVAMAIFDASAGQKVFVRASGPPAGGTMRLHGPTGWLDHSFITDCCASGGVEAASVTHDGSYTVTLTGGEGEVDLTAFVGVVDQEEEVAPTPEGVPVSLSFDTPGQNARLRFAGEAGRRVAVELPSGGLPAHVSTVDSDGIMLDPYPRQYVGSQQLYTTPTLPADGNYTIVVDIDDARVGSMEVVVREVLDVNYDVTPTAAGATTNVTLSEPGSTGRLRFYVQRGQQIAAKLQGSTMGPISARLIRPDGTVYYDFGSSSSSPRFIEPSTLYEAGTYVLELDPDGTRTGSVSATLYDVPDDQVITVSPTPQGDARTVSFTTPGTRARLQFAGQAGQEISLKASNFGPAVYLNILKPSAGSLTSQALYDQESDFKDAPTLPTNGTYTVLVDPAGGATGSVTITTYDATDAQYNTSLGAAPTPVSIQTPGQDAYVSFEATANQTITVTKSQQTLSSSCLSLVSASGGTLGSVSCGGPTSNPVLTRTPLTSGTWRVYVNPAGNAVGGIHVAVAAGGGSMAAASASRTALSAAEPVELASEPTTTTPEPAPKPPPGMTPSRTPGGTAHAFRRFRPTEDARWLATRAHRRGDWRADRPETPWEELPPLTAALGTTALAGQALELNGMPLAGLRVQVEGSPTAARTDSTGRFLLADVPPGKQVLVIDGRATGTDRRRYGVFEVKVDIASGRTTALDYRIWMPRLDRAGDERVASPTKRETVLTTPRIPGLEVRLPAGSVIRDADGRTVRDLNITPVPVDRPPFPLPAHIEVPVYFTVQPGRAYLSKGAQIIYPNYTNLPAGQRVEFWNYDADDRGWYIYGHGTVTKDRKRVIPDPNVRVWEFTGAMISGAVTPPATYPFPWASWTDGDPVDLGTGLFVYDKTDLALADTLPLELTRTYRANDANSYSFGIGTASNWDLRLYSVNNYTEADLILPDGGRVHYTRVGPGTELYGAVYQTESTPGPLYKSTLTWRDDLAIWELERTDGLVYEFGDMAPLQAIRDRFGNRITITRQDDAPNGPIEQITSPNGRWIRFTYDGANRIVLAQDNGGRSVSYDYDDGRLTSITDADGGVTTLTYNGAGRLRTMKDPRGITYLTNDYDALGRISQQTYAGGTYAYEYTLNEDDRIVTTRVTDPRGRVREVEFNQAGAPISDTHAAGTALAQTTTLERDDAQHVTSKTDALGRRTSYDYDANGNIIRTTELDGTPDASMTEYTYDDDVVSLLTSVTDPLDHTTRYDYDSLGRIARVTDPTGRSTTFQYGDDSQHPTAIVDGSGSTTRLGYRQGVLTTITDARGYVTQRFTDAIGQTRAVRDPLGGASKFEYNAHGQLTRSIDPAGRETRMAYDGNGNLASVTDPRGKTTSATYNDLDRVATTTDARDAVTRFEYDAGGNVVKRTDRKGQITTYRYDTLGRHTFTGFGTAGPPTAPTFESTIEYTFDAGDRVVRAEDSQCGAIVNTYDGHDRLQSQTTPQGAVSYGYDAAGRRTGMVPDGAAAVSYGYDDAGRLTSVSGWGMGAQFSYDLSGRRSSATLPNGTEASYSYDAASNVTDLVYSREGEPVGDIHYEHDALGRRTASWGTLSNARIPSSMGEAAYDAANRRVSQDGSALSYDANGNLTADGNNTYAWNARGQLTSISGAHTATFAYDAFGRRIAKTVGGATTSFLYDGPTAVRETAAGSATHLLTGASVDELLARTGPSGTDTILADALGSTLALAAADGSIGTSYAYDPFGATTAMGASSSNAHQFTRRENDGTGLYYYRARYYSPDMQRFISEDPIGLSGGDTNLYAYVGNDPVNFSDPSGLMRNYDNMKGGSKPRTRPKAPDGAKPPSLPGPAGTHLISPIDYRTVMAPGRAGHGPSGRPLIDVSLEEMLTGVIAVGLDVASCVAAGGIASAVGTPAAGAAATAFCWAGTAGVGIGVGLDLEDEDPSSIFLQSPSF